MFHVKVREHGSVTHSLQAGSLQWSLLQSWVAVTSSRKLKCHTNAEISKPLF